MSQDTPTRRTPTPFNRAAAPRKHDHTEDAAQHHAERLLLTAREELDRADSKAAILLAGFGVGTGALIHPLADHDWGADPPQPGVHLLWWITIIGISAGITSLARAIYPRKQRRRDPNPLITYYGDVAATRRSTLETRLARNSDDIRNITNDQLHEISVIVAKKYWHIRCALWLFALSAGAIIAAISSRNLIS